ncbi:cytochrome P450 6a2-like [Zophobas morio]|uniref:cytochrome P450 6a2-like n=1 Tax=Zophobas morio TaxID=2755281 RepID=UPI003082ED84
MGLLPYGAVLEVLLFVVPLVVAVLCYFHNRFKYWSRRGVPTIPPRFPLGNSKVLFPKGFTLGPITKIYYDYLKQRGHKFGGIYLISEPNLVIVDPDYVKDILSKDFQYFVDRGFYYNETDDPLSANLFALDGVRWRLLRTKFTPTFTSSKMKTMFQSVITCRDYMVEALGKQINDDIDIREVMRRYTIDCIGSCAFGVQCNSFIDPDAEFPKMGIKIFHFDMWKTVKAFFIVNLPKLSKWLRLTPNYKEIRDFFIKMVTDAIELRQNPENRRNDFLQILIDLKETEKLTVNEIAAQVFLFFLAGFETSSSMMSLALYQLAKNQDCQDKLREEILAVLERHEGRLNYESLSEMKLLGQVFDETLRLYPPGSTLTRRCVKDYSLRDTNIVIEKGTQVIVPAIGLHMDPEYFPDPEKFNPSRFSEEMKKSRHPCVFLPFGEGPRNCIGLRFGLMQSKIGIASVIVNFRLTVSPTCKPLQIDPDSFIVRPIHNVYLRAERF